MKREKGKVLIKNEKLKIKNGGKGVPKVRDSRT